MRNIWLAVLIIVLVFAELVLVTALLPGHWQESLFQVFHPINDRTTLTHPDLAGEIDRSINRRPSLRLAIDIIFVTLIAADAMAIRYFWRTLRNQHGRLRG